LKKLKNTSKKSRTPLATTFFSVYHKLEIGFVDAGEDHMGLGSKLSMWVCKKIEYVIFNLEKRRLGFTKDQIGFSYFWFCDS